MMRFQRSRDGLIIVEDDGGAIYIDTAANFAADAGQSAPGVAGLLLAPGKIECVIDAEGNQRASGLTAPQRANCVQWIGMVPALLAAQSARLAAVAAAAEAARVAAITPDEKRAMEYAARGASVDKLTVALWEYAIEGRTEAADALQLIRAQVKADIPK